jgi:hypothetical protein
MVLRRDDDGPFDVLVDHAVNSGAVVDTGAPREGFLSHGVCVGADRNRARAILVGWPG